jgi:5-formyltetrahydrofolate cyclo-ligase
MSDVNKQQQRKDLRRLASLHRDEDSVAVVEKLVVQLERFPNARIVSAYMAMPSEVDLRGLFGRIDKQWVFPRVRGEDLKFYRVKNIEEEMQLGAFGILEPKDDLEEVSVDAVDVFLCPGLGFDRKGGRLGRGRGFYDRMLKHAKPDAVKIGVCFPFQIVEEIALESHDVLMDMVVG